MITFKQQFDKLTSAYIHQQVDPLNDCGCFVGNLLNRNSEWSWDREWEQDRVKYKGLSFMPDTSYFKKCDTITSVLTREVEGIYTPDEILKLEALFIETYVSNNGDSEAFRPGRKASEQDEEALFKAFEATLELLKEIHISKGEEGIEEAVFVKRELA